VCYVGPDGRSRLVADGLRYPNGLVLTARGNALLLGEFLENRILEYRITAPGAVGQRRVFAELPNKSATVLSGPDGMTLDQAGRL
jgi:gluconolactonase